MAVTRRRVTLASRAVSIVFDLSRRSIAPKSAMIHMHVTSSCDVHMVYLECKVQTSEENQDLKYEIIGLVVYHTPSLYSTAEIICSLPYC